MGTRIVQTDFVQTEYGKDWVKLLQLRREGKVHYVKEVEINTRVTLNNYRDFVFGDNSDIIATDSQKNTCYILAKQFGIKTIEQFALLMCEHFLNKYRHVVNAKVYIEEQPWKRLELGGKSHVHAFVMNRDATRFCEVNFPRGEKPTISAGIKDLRIMKTTESAFKTFVDDGYRTLGDTEDRLFCTVVQSRWWYNDIKDLDFDSAWDTVKMTILEEFAGPPETGVFSPSVQNTLYLAEKKALARIPQIEQVEMKLPNVHYFNVDYNRFPKLEFKDSKDEIYLPTDKPSGNISATIKRSNCSKL